MLTTSEAPDTPATNFDPSEQVLEEGRSESPGNLPRGIGVASCFTEHMWYFAIAGDQLKRGAMFGKTM
ncbi:MAG: hypothetical protein K2X93_28120, partial [Candidatus Obscuribacterales bacterium]|nr:hypothetical protein [Candidatus Obscuribacterales bacterium]